MSTHALDGDGRGAESSWLDGDETIQVENVIDDGFVYLRVSKLVRSLSGVEVEGTILLDRDQAAWVATRLEVK